MDQIELKIADLRISIRCHQLPIHQENELAYLSFTDCGNEFEVAPDIEVELEVAGPPDIRGWEKTFEDGQSWSIFRNGDEYAMCFCPTRHGTEPLWVAQFSQKCDRVVIKCSKRFICTRNGQESLLNPFRYPLDQHLIMYHLAYKTGLLVHAAGFIHSDLGFIFPGRSGAGKSTLSRLLLPSERWQGLSDDRMIIRAINQQNLCFGTPWPGEEGVAKNGSVRLSGIFFLCHGQQNKVSELTPQEAIKKLMPVVSIPWYDKELVANLLPVCADIVSQIPVFELCFIPTEEVRESLEEFLILEYAIKNNGA